MCQILIKEPKALIKYEDLKNCILNNPDGFGLSFPDFDSNKLIVEKSPETPDVEALYRRLTEDLYETKAMLHLRFTTAGATNLRNAHPFPILEKRTDGVDLRMCHNGTLYRYKNMAQPSESDTRSFVRHFVRPLFKRLVRGMGPEEFMSDTFVQTLLEDALADSSVLAFIDGEGRSLVCNPKANGGGYKDGLYYSNSYSFQPRYRVDKKKETQKPPSNGKSIGKKPTSEVMEGSTNRTELFTDKFGLSDYRDLFKLTDATITAICSVTSPKPAELLIKELLFRLDHAEKRITTLTTELSSKNDKNFS